MVASRVLSMYISSASLFTSQDDVCGGVCGGVVCVGGVCGIEVDDSLSVV